jgi:hypothetical protein
MRTCLSLGGVGVKRVLFGYFSVIACFYPPITNFWNIYMFRSKCDSYFCTCSVGQNGHFDLTEHAQSAKVYAVPMTTNIPIKPWPRFKNHHFGS